MSSGYFNKLAELGFMVVCRRNALGTTTMFALRPADICPETGDLLLRWSGDSGDFSAVLQDLPEWRLVDFVGDDAARGAELLYQKLTCTGPYVNWDSMLGDLCQDKEFLIGFEHRPEGERFAQVED